MVAITKYYAVKKGRNPGIYTSWKECEKQVSGFSGAIFKSFGTEKEARIFIEKELHTHSKKITGKNKYYKKLIAYVDGSYNSTKNIYSYGCVLIDKNDITRLLGTGTDDNWAKLRNVAGEMLAVMKAIEWAYKHDFDSIEIFHDYEGVAKWASGEWKTNKSETREYVNFLASYLPKMNIEFFKVRAHTGDKYNDEADELAKKAILNWSNGQKVQVDLNKIEIDVKKIFSKQMSQKSNKKNNAVVLIKGYELSEEKLIKVAKEVWKRQGNLIKDIDSIKVTVEVNSLEISWEIYDRLGKIYNVKMVID